MSLTVAPHSLDQLRRSIRGEVITPDDARYDDARRLWNAVHDRRPAVVVRPLSAREVATSVAFAREQDLELQVRSGGHSAKGLAGADGGLVVDLSAMRGATVDPEGRLARVNGGALLGELDVEAQAHGLVCPVGVVGHTGTAGLTLGGGTGRLQRHFGLTIDNLRAVELVTADGRFVRASETEEPDLFWALRGAGWNFGIATAFEFDLHPFGPDLHRGVRTFPASRVHEAWERFAAYAATAPEAVSVIFGIAPAGGPGEGYPDDLAGKPIVYVTWNHSGAAEDVERDTAALLAIPEPLTATIGSQPYLDVQTAHDLVFAWGSRSHIRSHNASSVGARTLDEIVDLVGEARGESSFSATALGGAIGRVPEDAMAFTGRGATYDLSADASWTDGADDEFIADWCRRVIAAAEPGLTTGGYANGNADSGPEETRRIYGEAKLRRLSALKREWDPDNVFHVNHNVEPAPTS